MKKEELLAIGLTEEQANKVFAMNGADVEREKGKTEQVKSDLASAREQLSQRDKDMEELRKTAPDAEAVKKKLEDLQSKYNSETEQFKKQLADRDYTDAMTRAIAEKGVKFSSKAAERAYIADLKAKALELKDGALVGFDKYHEEQLAADPSAFASDKPAPFVKPIGPGGPPAVKSKGAMYAEQFNAQYAQATTK